jgi:hypothetical protein
LIQSHHAGLIRNPFVIDYLSFHHCSNDEITAVGAKPYILSLEDASVKDFVELFDKEKPDGVVFSAGAGGKGGEERTKAVDYEGKQLSLLDLIWPHLNRR